MRPLFFRDSVPADLPGIVSIYNSTVAGRMVTADTEPVTVESRWAWFYEHFANRRPLWVIEEHNTMVGWISFQNFYGRPAYNATAEISIYLCEEVRGRGLGKEGLQYCLEKAPSLGISNLVGYIFAHNLLSIRLFKRFGFEEWGHLPGIALLDGLERSLLILGKRI